MRDPHARRDAASRPLSIYTDGACQPNPGPGGWAAVIFDGDQTSEISGGEASTTNNRMELQAAISALRSLQTPATVDIYTDSQYLQQGITLWLPAWIARGWRRSGNQPVLNVDLWQELSTLAGKHRVRWHWLRGHSGHPHNERANRLAYQAITRRKIH
jgi:ribonuclease HI